MNKTFISHNPFTVHTEFLINDALPGDSCQLVSYRDIRLQQWVEKLFDDLRVIFNGEQRYSITFKGVESDFLDLSAAAEKARGPGAQIELKWEKVPPTEHRLERIRVLWDKVGRHPQMERHVNAEARKTVEEAFDRNFDVYVVATMSAGKSTLINAMLGARLLPAGNEATTAVIARITDSDQANDGFRAQRFDQAGKLLEEVANVDSDTLKDWNRAPDTFRVDLEGDIRAIREREDVRLVLTDTPGPNNSQNEQHRLTTMRHIKDSSRNPLILYILNGTQLGVDDDKYLLNQIADAMAKGGKQSKDRFIFIVNKMDTFDAERERISDVLVRVRDYLEKNGIKDAIVHPASAELALLLRLPPDKLTRKERTCLKEFAETLEDVPAMNLSQYVPVTDPVKRNLDAKNLDVKEISTGLPAVEAMIDEYIDKYNLPHRLKRVHDALSSVIDRALNEAKLNESLNCDEDELARIREEIAKLEERAAKGFDALAFKNRLEKERKFLPQETRKELLAFSSAFGKKLTDYGSRFENKLPRWFAEDRIKEVEDGLRKLYEESLLRLEEIRAASELQVKTALEQDYRQFVKNIFSEFDEVRFPTLERLQHCVTALSGDIKLDISNAHVETWSYSTSVWYKPWTWGDEGHGETVDLAGFWKDHLSRIEPAFHSLRKNATEQIEYGHAQLLGRMLQFMNDQFEPKLAELLATVKAKALSGKSKEEDIAYARKLLADIASIRRDLDGIISMEPSNG